MPKFKLKIFKSCRSKDPSTLPIPITPPKNHHHHHQPHRSSFKSHVSSAFGCGSKSIDNSDSDNYFQWQEDDQWHVVAKIYDVESPRKKIYNSSVSEDNNSDDDDDVFPLPLLPLPRLVVNKRQRRRGSKKIMNINGKSKNMIGCFDTERTSNNVETETETESLISSSRSFSTDSSTDFNPQLETIRENSVTTTNRHKPKKKRPTSFSKRTKRVYKNGMLTFSCKSGSGSSGTAGTGTTSASPEWGSPARLSVFKKMIPCNVEGKIKESFAIVKKSEDPYDDFKKSMLEMIMEKQMYEESDLEQLLQCFLSLNSRFHHGVIVEAFSEIWDTMFGAINDDHDHDLTSS
uniref:transcription repressor OFP7-like n=1 Tax=Erigeron canadensis TaxID=72917 RepID=UPI001CB8BC91|nr:transcription repressor OFP7-like [Erigeron canadensis]